ncbi:HEAT repeat domain-containing protein [Planctomicrobium sp. SH527]|uniref:HEAT repeat domain-containing protein n=1 Tax=Planctomicrobium sp. SH527 TaxID=3448123 RepID=UPI003F5C2D5D
MLAFTRTSMAIAVTLMIAIPGEAGLFTRTGGSQSQTTGGSCATPSTSVDCAAPTRQAPASYQRTCAPIAGDSCLSGDACTHIPHASCWPVGPVEADVSCTGSCVSLCDEQLRKLVVESKTACTARIRRAAVHKIGTNFACNQHTQVMPALVYALNDIDETVRAKAADKIGDQLRQCPCCCIPYVHKALQLSLGDCSSTVRIQAEQALVACGSKVVDPGKCVLQSNQCVSCAPFTTEPAAIAPAAVAPAAVAPAAIAPAAVAPSALHELMLPVRTPHQAEFSRLEIQERPVFEELPIPMDRPSRPSEVTTVVPAPLATKPISPAATDEPQFLPPKIGIAPREGQSIR